jgi:drug/metabolite transporter (DMT)-like permease
MTPPASPLPSSSRAADARFGRILVLISAVAWSFSGLLARMVTVDVWTATWFRALVAAVFLAGLLAFEYRGNTIGTLWRSLKAAPLAILCGAASMVLLMAAYFGTSVANVVVIYATAPFWAALIGWLFYGTRIDAGTALAAAAALVGVVTVVGGTALTQPAWGDLLAVAMTVTFIASSAMLGHAPAASSSAVTCIACVLTVLATTPLATPSALDGWNMFWLALFGLTTSGLAYVCFMAGARLIPTTEAGLIGVVEVPMAPLWTLLLLGEQPAAATIAGGGIILAAVLAHLGLQARQTMLPR